MTETKLEWGTITHDSDDDTGTTAVDVTVEAEADVSVSTMAALNATDEYRDDTTAGDDLETEPFPWGVVHYTTDDDTGATDVTVIVDAEDDVSVSVTTLSEDGTQESTSTVHQSSTTTAGADGDAGADVNVSQSTTVSQSSVNVESSAVAHGEDGDDGEDGSSVSIDID
ncbi:hypothetical protein [Natronorubrum bangense]|nr:hypothetical protein [Natronorubrum bangense]